MTTARAGVSTFVQARGARVDGNVIDCDSMMSPVRLCNSVTTSRKFAVISFVLFLASLHVSP